MGGEDACQRRFRVWSRRVHCLLVCQGSVIRLRRSTKVRSRRSLELRGAVQLHRCMSSVTVKKKLRKKNAGQKKKLWNSCLDSRSAFGDRPCWLALTRIAGLTCCAKRRDSLTFSRWSLPVASSGGQRWAHWTLEKQVPLTCLFGVRVVAVPHPLLPVAAGTQESRPEHRHWELIWSQPACHNSTRTEHQKTSPNTCSSMARDNPSANAWACWSPQGLPSCRKRRITL